MDHEQLYEKALQAINDLFSDTSVPQSTTAESLHGLIDEIRTMLDSLEE
jgi:polyhydroxyalkanoate synthesis regulator phasin